MAFMTAQDTINGSEGSVYVTLDGRVKEAGYVKKVDAKATLKKSEKRFIGSRSSSQKVTGWNGSGTVSLYDVTDDFRNLLVRYTQTGRLPLFDLVVTNDDPASRFGKQRVRLGGCMLDEVQVANFDVDSDGLETTFNFTFDRLDVLDTYKG